MCVFGRVLDDDNKEVELPLTMSLDDPESTASGKINSCDLSYVISKVCANVSSHCVRCKAL